MDRREKYFCIYHSSYTYDDEYGNCAACGAPRGAKASPSASVDSVRERGAGLEQPSGTYSMSPSVSASPSAQYYAVWDSK